MITQPFAIAPDDREARRAQAHRDGYLYLPQLLARDALAALRVLVDIALVKRGWIVGSEEPLAGATDPVLRFGRPDDARWFEFLQEVLPSDAYRALAADSRLVEAIRDVMDADPEMHAGDVCRIVSPGDPTLTTPAHQDAAYVKNPAVWAAWLPLVACPRELGPLAIWPGSNHGGLRSHAVGDGAGIEIPDDVVWATGDLDLGDVLLFSVMTVHRAMHNVTPDRLRVSVDYRYRPRTSAA